MTLVKFSSATHLVNEYYLRQFPGGLPYWEDCQFEINNASDQCDYWIVYDDLINKEKVNCRQGGKILITAEPPEVREYDSKFLAQFDVIVTVDKNIKHPNPIYSQQALNWMVGWNFFTKDQFDIKNFEHFETNKFEHKTKLISMIASKKTITEGHQQRYNFAMALKDHFGDQMDLFGLGIREIDDKYDALHDYQYTLSIENSKIPHYWTEKLSDAFLTLTFPFYHGCNNIFDYFPENSLGRINIKDIAGSIKIIEKSIKEKRREKSINELVEARRLTMYQHNVFALITRITKNISLQSGNQKYINTELRPYRYYSGTVWNRLKSKIVNFV